MIADRLRISEQRRISPPESVGGDAYREPCGMGPLRGNFSALFHFMA
jgi:hypothetical protein